MIDIISANNLIKRLFPSQRQLIANTIGECLWFCIPVHTEKDGKKSTSEKKMNKYK